MKSHSRVLYGFIWGSGEFKLIFRINIYCLANYPSFSLLLSKFSEAKNKRNICGGPAPILNFLSLI